MPYVALPPALVERRSDEREVFFLINALRRRLQDLTNPDTGSSSALFSIPIGRGDVLTTKTDGVEVVGINFELPRVFDSFNIFFAAQAEDTGSAGTCRLRLGGTYGATDGVVVATMSVPVNAYERIEVTGSAGPGNTSTLIKLTLQSAVGQKLSFRGGFVEGQ